MNFSKICTVVDYYTGGGAVVSSKNGFVIAFNTNDATYEDIEIPVVVDDSGSEKEIADAIVKSLAKYFESLDVFAGVTMLLKENISDTYDSALLSVLQFKSYALGLLAGVAVALGVDVKTDSFSLTHVYGDDGNVVSIFCNIRTRGVWHGFDVDAINMKESAKNVSFDERKFAIDLLSLSCTPLANFFHAEIGYIVEYMGFAVDDVARGIYTAALAKEEL